MFHNSFYDGFLTTNSVHMTETPITDFEGQVITHNDNSTQFEYSVSTDH